MDPGPVIRLAPAKLNLTLAVVGRRSDGFHELHSIMVTLGLADRLSLAQAGAREDVLHVAGPDSGPLADNLVLRGIAETRRAVGRAAETWPLAARLEKHIPVAGGLGGGSSDAAAAIDGSLEAWATQLAAHDRFATAARVGSDVPFFVVGGAALIEGRGERVTPLGGIVGEPPGVLLVTPAAGASTRDVYETLDRAGPGAASDPRSTRVTSEHLATELRGGLRATDLVARAGVLATANDLAPAASIVVDGLRDLRRSLIHRLGRPVGLSGSGPTLWVLYPSLEAARVAAGEVRAMVDAGDLPAPGTDSPSIIATTIDAPIGTSAGRGADAGEGSTG